MQKSSVIPALRYRDAPAAIDWLCRVFGFERHLVVPDAHGGIAHDEDYGGRGFSCFDLEGHLWAVGTYDPWADPA
ncbi:MAG TPA: hypothetical protein VF319_13720 [Caldimonas sp.]